MAIQGAGNQGNPGNQSIAAAQPGGVGLGAPYNSAGSMPGAPDFAGQAMSMIQWMMAAFSPAKAEGEDATKTEASDKSEDKKKGAKSDGTPEKLTSTGKEETPEKPTPYKSEFGLSLGADKAIKKFGDGAKARQDAARRAELGRSILGADTARLPDVPHYESREQYYGKPSPLDESYKFGDGSKNAEAGSGLHLGSDTPDES